ncbi:hypothetical protein DFQ30_003830, partial [Apophysomyces sp. BC1015]
MSVNKKLLSLYTTVPNDKTSENHTKKHLAHLKADKEHLNALNAMCTTDLPLYSIKCNGQPITVLLDTGAGSSYITPWLVQGLPAQEVEGREVETAGGHKLSVNAK